MTRRCLESLEYGRPDEVIVYDDGHIYPARELHNMDNLYDKWLVAGPGNYGYAVTVNAGMAAATGDVLIVSNNDIEFVPGWLDGILLPIKRGYDISSIRTTDNSGYETEDKVTEGDKFGSIWAITRQAYERLGGLDTRFGKGYFEDLDYRRRAIEAGLRVAKYHGVTVEHVGKATFSHVDPDDEAYNRARQIYQDKWGFVE